MAFTNITGENFKRTQALALDLATALEMDLGAASLQLGKALSDPATKLSSLSRAGIAFSKEQTEVIKKLAETGDIAKAQAMILDELERKFGGQAEAAARTGLGAVQQLKNAWGDFLERIGAAIMPFATKIAGALSTVVQMLQSMSPAMMQTIVVVAGLVAAVGPLSLGIGAVIKVLPMLAAGFTALLSPVGLIMAAVLALGAAFAYARIQKQKMIDEMAETESLDELERKLQENIAEQKEIIATTTKTRMVPNFGGLVAGFTLQKVPDESKLAPLRKEYDLLTAAIEKKRETEKKAAEAQAELDKVTDEARKQTEELMKSIAGTNAQTEQSTGIIGKLQERIEALEKKKLLPESTVEDIAAANAEIEKLQKELERIKNIKPEDLKPVVKKDGILPEGFELELPAPKLKMGDLKPVTSQYAQQMLAIFGAVREGLYGWADDNSAYLQEHVADTVSMVENYTTTLTAKGWSFSAALEPCPRHDCGGDDALRSAGVEVYGRQHRRSGGGYRADHCRRFGIRRADESDPDAVRLLSEKYRLATHRVRRDDHRLQIGAEIRPRQSVGGDRHRSSDGRGSGRDDGTHQQECGEEHTGIGQRRYGIRPYLCDGRRQPQCRYGSRSHRTAVEVAGDAPDGRQPAEPTNNPWRSIDCQGSGFGVCSRKRELQVRGVGWLDAVLNMGIHE